MAKILVIFPKTTVFEDPMVFPPLGCFYIVAALQQAGHDADFIDMSEYCQSPDGTRMDIRTDPPSSGYDAYLVSGTTPQAKEIRRLGRYLRDRGCVTIAGGPHVTNYSGSVTVPGALPLMAAGAPVDRDLLANFHILVKGEGEHAVLTALGRIPEAQEHMAKHGRGIVMEEPKIDDLGTVPIPERTAALDYRYSLDDANGRKRRVTTMFSCRGCPERCAFCDSPALWGRGVRYVPMPSILEEFTQIKGLGFDGIHFFDDILPLKQSRMVEMAEHLRGFGFIWRCFIRVDIMTKPSYGKDFLAMLHAHGLREVLVGVESGDQRILDGIHKGTTVEQNSQVLAWCKEIGIAFKASVILGLPGEDRQSMEATLQWILTHRPDRVNYCTYIPFLGTPISKGTDEGKLWQYGKDAIHDYDIRLEIDPNDLISGDYYYAGSRDGLQVVTSTSHLSRQEMQEFWHYACSQIKAAGIPY